MKIKEEIKTDWISQLDGMTREQAIEYLTSLPQGAELSVHWHGYDGADGEVVVYRDETEEELTNRLKHEQRKELEKALVKAGKLLDDLENQMSILTKPELKDFLDDTKLKKLDNSIKSQEGIIYKLEKQIEELY